MEEMISKHLKDIKKLLKNQPKGNVMQNDKIYEVASDLYFYFIDLYGAYHKKYTWEI
jgi:hypothetical protein